jgi:hypothetical protein
MVMSKPPRHWQPLVKSDYSVLRPEVIAAGVKHYGVSEEEIRRRLALEGGEFWVNDLYQVQLIYCGEDGHKGAIHLNIRRRDGGPAGHDWRHYQEIKNQLAGPEREAFEIYPAESRKVDTSNKWHLWVLPEGERIPCGWQERDVQYDENRNVPGIRQRPL